MVPQAGNATSVVGSTFSTALNTAHLYCVTPDTVKITAGNLIGFFLSGAAVILGILSTLIFSSSEGRPRRHLFLYTYTTLLILILAAAETTIFVNYIHGAITISWPVSEQAALGLKLSKLSYALDLLVIALTDGLLVWRCFLVQRVLGRGSSKWSAVFWVFPACLWVVTLALGGVATAKYPHHQRLFAIALVSNIVLNLHATIFITTRLLLHRRAILACVPDKKLATRHIYIVGILLESAAINLPFAITTVFTTAVGSTLDLIMVPIVIASQALAAILIIHQTALGKVFNEEKENEITRLVETGEHSLSGSVDPPSENPKPRSLLHDA